MLKNVNIYSSTYLMNSNLKVLAEQYQLMIEKRVQPDPTTEESLVQFLDKRLAGAEKIANSSEHKGGFATLTAIHYKAKLKPYKECGKMEKSPDKDCDTTNAHYKKMAEELHAKLADLDKLTQKEFQSLMGELEVYGEVYIRATKPNSLKI
jgi:hypothetical protein